MIDSTVWTKMNWWNNESCSYPHYQFVLVLHDHTEFVTLITTLITGIVLFFFKIELVWYFLEVELLAWNYGQNRPKPELFLRNTTYRLYNWFSLGFFDFFKFLHNDWDILHSQVQTAHHSSDWSRYSQDLDLLSAFCAKHWFKRHLRP